MSGSRIREVRFPNNDQLRSRKVVTRYRARSTGKFPSFKMGRMMQRGSSHELNDHTTAHNWTCQARLGETLPYSTRPLIATLTFSAFFRNEIPHKGFNLLET
jgi:hypothetical protein